MIQWSIEDFLLLIGCLEADSIQVSIPRFAVVAIHFVKIPVVDFCLQILLGAVDIHGGQGDFYVEGFGIAKLKIQEILGR